MVFFGAAHRWSCSTILSRDSNYIVDVVTLPKFDNSSISLTEVIITSSLKEFEQKRWPWFKLNNLGLTLCMNLKFYTSVTNGLKLKVKKFWILIQVTREKLVRGGRGWRGAF